MSRLSIHSFRFSTTTSSAVVRSCLKIILQLPPQTSLEWTEEQLSGIVSIPSTRQQSRCLVLHEKRFDESLFTLVKRFKLNMSKTNKSINFCSLRLTLNRFLIKGDDATNVKTLASCLATNLWEWFILMVSNTRVSNDAQFIHNF